MGDGQTALISENDVEYFALNAYTQYKNRSKATYNMRTFVLKQTLHPIPFVVLDVVRW